MPLANKKKTPSRQKTAKKVRKYIDEIVKKRKAEAKEKSEKVSIVGSAVSKK